MNKNLLIICCLLAFQSFVAQVSNHNISSLKVIMPETTLDKESRELYDLGNVAFAKKEYDRADSLFTISLKILPHPDTYFNRSVCRRRMNDFSGYCFDLGAAANMDDKESYMLYCKECAKIDTFYTTRDNGLATYANFEFATFTTSYKYNTNGEYEKYDKTGNMLLSYIIMGSDTIYLKSNEVIGAIYPGGNKAIEEFIKTNTGFYNKVNKSKKRGFVNLALTIGVNGKIRRVKVLVGLRDGSSDSLAKALYKLDPYEPAKYKEKNVKYQSNICVSFGQNSLTTYEIRPKYKIFSGLHTLPDTAKEVFTVVEEMPEFPGGPMEMMKFIQSNIKLPLEAKERGINGKCFLKFVVGPDGFIYNVEIIKGVERCSECDAEAIRVVSMMPKWKSGSQNGKAVSCFFNLPINFQVR